MRNKVELVGRLGKKTNIRKQMLKGAGFQPGKNSWYKLAEAA